MAFSYREYRTGLKEKVDETWNLSDAPAYITKYTYHRGARFSFKDHEFQHTILSDPAQVVNTQKCSQIGMSEATARWTVAIVNMIPDFSVIVTFPFSGDASDFARTRIDPFVEASPKLREAVNAKQNSGDIKRFGNSFIYFRGTNGKTQAISIPADAIVSDEIDRSDPVILSQYHSRLTHSNWKLRRNFSTPTIPGFGIALEMETSLRYRNICKCNHCARDFLPNYFEHVKIPGFDNDLRSITKSNLHKIRYLEAQLLCPHCGKEPDLSPKQREYVIENNTENHAAHGYFVSPFDAPKIITVPDLIKSSTQYAKYSEFVNQNLGLAEEDASEAITLMDLNKAMLDAPLVSSSLHCMGIDVGTLCYVTVGRLSMEGQFLIVHRERVPIGNLETRKRELQREYRIIMTVMDSLPYTDTVQRFQVSDKNFYGAVYSNSKALETYKVKMFEGDVSEGKLPIHTVQINRDVCFDALMYVIKRGEMIVARKNEEEDELFQKHMLDMRRVQVFNDHNELQWQWVKSKTQQDHYHHSTLYLHIACQMRGAATLAMPVNAGMILRTFPVKQPKVLT